MTDQSSSTMSRLQQANVGFARLQQANVGFASFLESIQSYLVEAAYFLFFLVRHMSLPMFQEYVQHEIYKQHHILNSDNSPKNETSVAQRESAVVVLSLQIAEGLPAVVSVIILGALSDRTGRRKILLWMPALGSTVYCLIYILIQYTGWSLDGLFMASAIRGLSGSMTAFLAGGSYYAINVVKPHQRSSRLALQELLNGAAYAVGNIMVGFWVEASGFLQPFWFCFICSTLAFLISFFLVKEIRHESTVVQPRRIDTGNCCIDTFGPMARFFKCRGNMKLVRIWLAILAFQTYAIVHIGQINTLVLYLLGEPLSWEVTRIGVFLSVAMACAAISTGVAPPILRNYITETHIAFAGFFSKAIGTLWISVVQNGTIIYFGILLLCLELLPFPMMRAIVAKDIEPAEQGNHTQVYNPCAVSLGLCAAFIVMFWGYKAGSLFALMHSGESISYFLAPLMFQSIYANTLHYYAGFVFIVSALLLLLPLCFTLGIRYIDLRMPGEQYENMEGESELVTSEEPPDITDSALTDHTYDSAPYDDTTPKMMTTHLSGYPAESRTSHVPGEGV